MMPSDQDYQCHTVFCELDRYIEFYKLLANSVFQFVSIGTRAICNIDSYVFSSIEGTLKSIRTILHDGRINDAYALLRKYFDSAIITIYSNLYLEEHCSIENFIVQQIDKWLNGKDSLPEYRVMSAYIRNSPKVAAITQIIYADDHYKKLRNRCNDHTHYNFYSNLLLNDPAIYIEKRLKTLNEFTIDVRDIFILHISYLFYSKCHYMASSDYIDSLECGLIPEKDSQYWVAPFVQEIFDEVLKKYRPDVAARIKDHTCMQLK